MSFPAILCVDDERDVLLSLRTHLLKHFPEYRIELSGSAEEALERVANILSDGSKIALAIVDQDMPGGNGDEFLMALHDLCPEILQILLLDHMSAAIVDNLVQRGHLYRFVIKPWHEADLVLTVTEALKRYSQERQLFQQQVALEEANRKLADRERLELSLKASESKLHDILNSACFSSIVRFRVFADRTWAYEYQSPGCEALFGYTAQEICENQTLWMSRVLAEDRETILYPLFEDIFNSQTKTVEFRFSHKDGSLRWISATYVSRYDETAECWIVTGVSTDISSRKIAELALHQSEAKFQEIAAASPAVIFTISIEPGGMPHFEYLSPSAEEIHELPVSALLQNGTLILDQIHPEDQLVYQQVSTQCLETLQPFQLEWRIITPSGKIKWLNANSRPQRRDTGKIVWHGIAIDISDRKQVEEERKQAEIALQESEARYRTLTEISPVGIFRFDRPMNCVYVNDRWSEMTGRSKESSLGSGWTAAIHPEDREYLLSYWAETYTQSSTETVIEQGEGRHLRPDGSINWFYVQVASELDATGAVIGYVGALTDITARKQAEEALAQEILRRKTFFDTSIDGIAVLDQAGQVIEANQSFAKMLGYSLDEVTTLNLKDFDVNWTQEELGQKIETHQLCGNTFETRHRRKDGSTYAVEISSNALDWHGQSVQFCICRDISERKRIEAERIRVEHELQAMKDSAEAANQAKSAFLASMSHELRTPLTAILGFAELMQHKSNLSPDDQQYLELIYTSGTRLLKLINEILDLSKIEAGKIILEPQPIDLFDQIPSLCRTLRGQISRKNLEFYLEISSDVPQYVEVDPQKLQQILLNLLSNAIKFTEVGKIALRVKQVGENVSASPQRLPFLLFEVEDTGVGIAPQDLNLIFDAFAQTPVGQHIQGGTGLGLTISRRLAQLMGGDLTVQSQLRQGSMFCLTLPLKAVSKTALQVSQPRRSVIGLAPNQGAYRILVVDDQAENRLLLVRLLQRLGLLVQAAANGEEAMILWQQWQPDLIWMDMRMPDLDGYEVTQRIRAEEQGSADRLEGNHRSSASPFDTPSPRSSTIIIALTAQALPDDRVRAIAAGCNDYITKPFVEETLLDKMAEHLGLVYLYENHDSGPYSSTQAVGAVSLAPGNFAVMPRDWVVALHQASLLCEDVVIKQLLEQIPPEDVSLAHGLEHLTQNFDFEQIMELTESYLGTHPQ